MGRKTLALMIGVVFATSVFANDGGTPPAPAAPAPAPQKTVVGQTVTTKVDTEVAAAAQAVTGPVGVTNSTVYQNSVLIPIPIPPLPSTMGQGSMTLTKVGECGPNVSIEPYRQNLINKQLFFGDEEIPVQTVHGKPALPKVNAAPSPLYYTEEITTLRGTRVVIRRGSALYAAVGVVSGGGGGGASLGWSGGESAAAGWSRNAGFTFGQVGFVTVPCIVEQYEVQPQKEATVPTRGGILVTERIEQGFHREKRPCPKGGCRPKDSYWVTVPDTPTTTRTQRPLSPEEMRGMAGAQ